MTFAYHGGPLDGQTRTLGATGKPMTARWDAAREVYLTYLTLAECADAEPERSDDREPTP